MAAPWLLPVGGECMRKVMSLLGFVLILGSIGDVLPGASEPVRLTGIVSSDAEGPMEGVVVSAKRAGSTIAVAVVTDRQGRYSFPASRLAPGGYRLSIRAVGYVSANPQILVTVGKGKGEADIKLTKTSNIEPQLSNLDWLMSSPGPDKQKQKMFVGCLGCHSLTPIFESTYDAAGWVTTLTRMHNWIAGSSIEKPISSPFHAGPHPGDEEFAKYLSTINLNSKSTHDFELKMMPRPQGEDTKVIVTEYDLPRPNAEPHDAVVDREGMVWYDDYAEPIVGRLNPRTGEIHEWRDPLVKPGYNAGFLDLELDREGNPWVGRPAPGFNGFAKFDKRTQKFTNWTDPVKFDNSETKKVHGDINFIIPLPSTSFIAISPDGKVWNRDSFTNQVFRLDPATGKIATFDEFPPEIMSKDYRGPEHRLYGITADSEGNLYEADIEVGNIVKVDGVTGKATMYPTPTPRSGPRRMHMDPQGHLWIGEDFVQKIAMFDTKTEQFQEWPVDIPWWAPYDVAPDKNGYIWADSVNSDLIIRFNPKTEEYRHYLLPSLNANLRRADVDNSGPHPVFWAGENQRAKIAKVEPIE
jgi:virginiamycin B lyase